MNDHEHGDRRVIVRDGAVMVVLVAIVWSLRVWFQNAIDPWAHDLADALAPTTLGVLTLGCLAVWIVMAVKGAEKPLDRWMARFVAGWFLVALALWQGLTRWPLMTLLVIVVVIWATVGMLGTMVDRYLGGVPWWLLAAGLAVVLVVAAVMR